MSNLGKFLRATIDELWQRPNKFSRVESDQVYTNGENNQYPKEIELIINNSPSATLGAKTKEKFLIGQGFNFDNDKIYNTKTNQTLYQIGRSVCRTLSRQGGFFIHRTFKIGEDGNFVTNEIQNLNFLNCRIAKEDDAGYEGLIYYKDWSKKGWFDKSSENTKWFYPFSDDQKVIREQLKNDAGIKHKTTLDTEDLKLMLQKQRGQVLYVNSTPEYAYPIAPIDAAYNDADTEYRISVYANNSARHGFQKKKIVATNSLDTQESDDIRETLTALLGIDSTAGFGLIELQNVETISDYIKVIELDADFDDRQFEQTERRVRKNILACFGIPEALISTTDVNIFGNSGESFRQMKYFVNQQMEDERQMVRDAFALVLDNNDLEIIKLNDLENEINTA